MQPNRIVLLVCLLAGRLYAEPGSGDHLCHSTALTTPAAALQSCSAAIGAGDRSNAELARLYNSRGIAHQALQDLALALQDYDQALRLDPRYSDAFGNRGTVYHAKGIYDRAIQDYSAAIRLNPRAQVAFRSRGIAHFCLGHFDEASSDLTAALDMDPADAFSAIWLYLAQRKQERSPAVDLKGTAAKLKPGEWPVQVIELFSGAQPAKDYLDSLGDLDPARDKLQRCEGLFFLAEYTLLSGDSAKAIEFFQAAIETRVTEDFEYTAALSEMRRLQKP